MAKNGPASHDSSRGHDHDDEISSGSFLAHTRIGFDRLFRGFASRCRPRAYFWARWLATSGAGGRGQLGVLLKETLTSQVAAPILSRALESKEVDDAVAEFRAVVGEFFDLLNSNRHGIKLLDRCVDHPEIRDLWQTVGREQPRLLIGRLLEQRAATGQLRLVEDSRFSARLLIETIATWAVHIHWDRSPQNLDFTRVREHTIEYLTRAFAV
jgi:hypothetical protein